jgi:hypothetical protein
MRLWTALRYDCHVKRREEWRRVLEAEMRRWSAMSCDQLISALPVVQAYEVESESKKYQIEVELLENTDGYVHVGIAVDNGRFWRAMRPLSSSFISKKNGSTC